MPQTLTEAIIASSTIFLRQNIAENNGNLDLERYQNELSVLLNPYISDLQEASEAWKSLYVDLQNHKMRYSDIRQL